MNTTRTITHDSNHTDIETYLQDADGVWMWAVTQCNGGDMSDNKATYEFDYAMKRLKDAIDYAQETGIFVEARLWSLHVEAAYNADIAAEQELTKAANAGAKLMHSLATGGESRLDADLAAMLQWEDEKPITGINWQNYPDFEDEPKEAQPKIDFNSIPEIKF